MPEDAGTIYSSVMLKLGELEKGVVKVHTILDGMSKKSQKQSSGFAGFWKNAFQTAFGFGIVQLINKVTSAVRSALSIFAGFQQSMRNVQSVTGATGEEFQRMTDAAKEAGETTRFTAREAADALYYLGSAGFSAQQSISALDGVLQLAGATQSDLASTSETVAATISQYGLQAVDATRVSNVFTAAITNSQATMEKLSNSFRQVGPVAAGFGYTLEDTVGALQELYNAGFRGQQAGRALKSALADLASPTANIEKILAKYNIELGKVNPATTEFTDIIDTLAQSGMTTSDIIDAFGKVAGPQMAVLIREGGDALRKYTDDITNTNAAAEAYEIQNDSLAGSLDFLKSKLEGTAIAIFEKLEPGMRDLIDSFISFLDATRPVGELLGSILNIFFKLASFSTGAVTKVFEGLFSTFRNMKSPMQDATESFDKVKKAIQEAGEIQNTANRLSRLTDEYEKLTSKTDLTEREQNRLKKVIAEIEKIAPDAATQIDEYGNAIEISGEKSREAARQMLESRKAIIEQSKASLDVVKPSLEGLLKVRENQLIQLKKEEQQTARLNRITEGRFSTLNEMKIAYEELQEQEIFLGKATLNAGRSMTVTQESFNRFAKALKEFDLPANKFKQAGGNIGKILRLIDQELITAERDYRNYQELLNKRIEVDIEVLDIRKKLDELANLELELKSIDEGIKDLDKSTEEATGKSEEYTKAAIDFWTNFRLEMEKATNEATLFGDKQAVLKATLDFLKKAYLDLIEEGLDPASNTLTRLRQEYDLTLIALNKQIEADKKLIEEEKEKEQIYNDIIKLTDDYYEKTNELGKSEEDLIEIEREKAIAMVEGMNASEEATAAAIEAIDIYYDKLQENLEATKEASQETEEAFRDTFEKILGYAQQLAGALSGLFDEITQDRLDALDDWLQAELENAGLLEETERERLERELQDAINAGDEETAQNLQDALDRLEIEEEYEKQKAWIEYKGALAEWRLSLLSAIASGAQAVLSALEIPPPLGWVFAGISGALAGVQIATVAKQKPTPPSFESGGLYTGPGSGDGPTGGDMAELHPPEMILNPDQMSNLYDIINNGGGSGNSEITVIIELDGSPIYKGVEYAQQSGIIRFKANRLI